MENSEATWHSLPLYVFYQCLGWFAFAAWSCSFYPQVILNFRRKSVVGLNFDFVLLNLTKHSSYLIYNCCLYFSPTVQRQYHEKYGSSELIPVATSDVAFSIDAVTLTAFTAYQILIYERGGQKVSITARVISTGAWTAVGVCLLISWPNGRWLWLASVFNLIQVAMTLIKYIPQVYMNFRRKSTLGWSIGNILLDLSGGLANLFQMGVQSIDQDSVENFSGNIGKLLLSLVVVAFDLVFVVQHYLLYNETKIPDSAYHPLPEENIKAEAKNNTESQDM